MAVRMDVCQSRPAKLFIASIITERALRALFASRVAPIEGAKLGTGARRFLFRHHDTEADHARYGLISIWHQRLFCFPSVRWRPIWGALYFV